MPREGAENRPEQHKWQTAERVRRDEAAGHGPEKTGQTDEDQTRAEVAKEQSQLGVHGVILSTVMTTPTPPSDASFDALIETVAACRACPSMEGRRRVLSHANGDVDARVLFIAEAPGRLGAELTGIPLTNDQSGRNFERFLAEAGLGRDDIFVTNAVLCNPRGDGGLNRPPTRAELTHCAVHLRAQLALVTAPIVVTLGAVALRAIEEIQPHRLSLSKNVAVPTTWNGRWLVPLFHPSPQAFMSRSLAHQLADYRELGRLLREIVRPTV